MQMYNSALFLYVSAQLKILVCRTQIFLEISICICMINLKTISKYMFD